MLIYQRVKITESPFPLELGDALGISPSPHLAMGPGGFHRLLATGVGITCRSPSLLTLW